MIRFPLCCYSSLSLDASLSLFLYPPPPPSPFVHPYCSSTSNPVCMSRLEKSHSLSADVQSKEYCLFGVFFLLLLLLFSFFFLDRIRSPCSHASKGIFNSQSYASCFQKLLNDTDSIVSRLVCEQFASVVAGAEFKEPPSSFLTESKQSAAFICFSHVYHSAAAEPLILSSLSLFICLDSLSHRGKLWLCLSSRRPSVPLMQRPALSVLQDNQLT